MLKCPVCQLQVEDDSREKYTECPGCKTQIGPVPANQLISATLEWEHMRFIVNLALNSVTKEMASDPEFVMVMDFILDNIRKSKPKDGAPLTLEEEFQAALEDEDSVNEMLVDASAREHKGPVDTLEPFELPSGKKVYLN